MSHQDNILRFPPQLTGAELFLVSLALDKTIKFIIFSPYRGIEQLFIEIFLLCHGGKRGLFSKYYCFFRTKASKMQTDYAQA